MKKSILLTNSLVVILGLFSVSGCSIVKDLLIRPGNPYDLVHSLDAQFIEWYPCIADNQNDGQAFDPVSSFRQSELERVAVCGVLTSTHETVMEIWWFFENNNKPFALSSTDLGIRFEAGFHSFSLVDHLRLSTDLLGYQEIKGQLDNGQLPTGWYTIEANVGTRIIGQVNFEVTP